MISINQTESEKKFEVSPNILQLLKGCMYTSRKIAEISHNKIINRKTDTKAML